MNEGWRAVLVRRGWLCATAGWLWQNLWTSLPVSCSWNIQRLVSRQSYDRSVINVLCPVEWYHYCKVILSSKGHHDICHFIKVFCISFLQNISCNQFHLSVTSSNYFVLSLSQFFVCNQFHFHFKRTKNYHKYEHCKSDAIWCNLTHDDSRMHYTFQTSSKARSFSWFMFNFELKYDLYPYPYAMCVKSPTPLVLPCNSDNVNTKPTNSMSLPKTHLSRHTCKAKCLCLYADNQTNNEVSKCFWCEHTHTQKEQTLQAVQCGYTNSQSRKKPYHYMSWVWTHPQSQALCTVHHACEHTQSHVP